MLVKGNSIVAGGTNYFRRGKIPSLRKNYFRFWKHNFREGKNTFR